MSLSNASKPFTDLESKEKMTPLPDWVKAMENREVRDKPPRIVSTKQRKAVGG